jgi:gas vesicle protein
MKYAVGFFIGAVVGAAVALLYAPSSGEELRTNIKTQADTQYARVQNQFQKGLQGLQTRVDEMSSDLQAVSSGSKEKDGS